MRKSKKLAVLTIISSIIFANLWGGAINSNALEVTTSSSTYDDNNCPKHPYPRGGGLLKESVSELKESGALTEDDVNNINSYMRKDRESKEAEIKNQIYKSECEKIDKMVNEKVITKEKGEKLKATVKENIQNLKRNVKKLNSN